MTNQGKLLTKHKLPSFVVRLELTLALPWTIEINGSKICFIAILCVKMSRVNKALDNRS